MLNLIFLVSKSSVRNNSTNINKFLYLCQYVINFNYILTLQETLMNYKSIKLRL